MTWLGQVQE